jgi:2-polyprenyl-3-methyl-5-hydroxy-6-metoxy-1,4-benzoquinol methylase
MVNTVLKRLAIRIFGESLSRNTYVRIKHRKRIIKGQIADVEPIAIAKARWQNVEPDAGLTWGRQDLNGDNFIQKVLVYGGFGKEKNVLEIGPGWGRLLIALLKQNISFKSYTGVDLSAKNIEYLKRKYRDYSNIHFEVADIEIMNFNIKFNTIMSSLTFKHMYPSFEKSLDNISKNTTQDGKVIFDLIEGRLKYFEQDNTFIRQYCKDEVKNILIRCGFSHVNFDEVEHAPRQKRLLVIASKSSIVG